MGGKRRQYKEHKSGDDDFRFWKQVSNINLLSLLRSKAYRHYVSHKLQFYYYNYFYEHPLD